MPVTAVKADCTCKLLRLISGRCMVCLIMEMVGNRSFTLTTGNGKRSRLRRLKSSVPPASVLAPLLFNIYISDLPATVSKKYAYANDLANMYADGDGTNSGRCAKQRHATASEYLQTWKLKLTTTKAVLAVFHLNNNDAKRELKINHNNETIPFCSELAYLEGMLDRTVTSCRHLVSFRKKLTSRFAFLRRLVGYVWGAGATTLRTGTLALVHSTTE